MSDFEKAIAVIIKHEVLPGHEIENIGDGAGVTHFWITQIFLDEYAPDVALDSIRTLDDAVAVTRRAWDRWEFPFLIDDDIATKTFDALILMGFYHAFRCAQTAACMVGHPCDRDGVMGIHTRTALNNCHFLTWNPHMRQAMTDHLILVAHRDPTKQEYLKGWLKRTHWPQEA